MSFVDLAPTIFRAEGVDWARSGMQPVAGSSLMEILLAEQSAQVDPAHNHVLIGKELHEIG